MSDSADIDLDADSDLGSSPDDPVELSTQADNERPLSYAEAAVAGMVPGMAVYGDSSQEPNADDHRQAEEA